MSLQDTTLGEVMPGGFLLVLSLVAPMAGVRLAFAVGSRRVEGIALSIMPIGLAIGLRLTEQARSLQGSPVVVRGYMAPPLAERGRRFVLTKRPLQTCRSATTAFWLDDALPKSLEADSHFVEPSHQIEVVGELEILNRMETDRSAFRAPCQRQVAAALGVLRSPIARRGRAIRNQPGR